MANGRAVEQVAAIVNSDEERRYIVVSAPGKRFAGDTKVTDLLYACFGEIAKNGTCNVAFSDIKSRFEEIVQAAVPNFDILEILDEVKRNMERDASKDYIASRGEYMSARLLAAKLGVEFIDADGLIEFDMGGNVLLDKSIENIKTRLAGVRRAVFPGFYGSDTCGSVRTFSRGGSDISGAIIAAALNADIYENWTDVDGFLAADPRIVENPKTIDCLGYRELRELSYMGADVLHPESVFPVRRAGIPINIKNTFDPTSRGTMIVADKVLPHEHNAITGIAGKQGFTIINIEKDMMNSEVGFGRKALSVLEDEGISFEHLPSGIDTLSIVIRDEYLNGKMQKVLARLQDCVNGDNIDIHRGLALIATVGHNMRRGTAAKLFQALSDSNINIRLIDLGSSELNIIVGVDGENYVEAVRAIHHSFFG